MICCTAAPRPATTRCASKSRAAHAGPGPGGAGTGARPCLQACSEELEYLKSRALPVRPSGAAYSINRGTVGRHHRRQGNPRPQAAAFRSEASGTRTRDAYTKLTRPERHVIRFFEQGRPVALDGKINHRGGTYRAARGARGAVRYRPAASIWATPSPSAPRGGWRSRRRRPRRAGRASRTGETGALRRASSVSRSW